MRVVARRRIVLNISMMPSTLLVVARIELLRLISLTNGPLVHTKIEGKVVRRL